MAASSNPPPNKQDNAGSSVTATSTHDAVVNGGGIDNSQTKAALKHNSGISVEWSNNEQSILKELLKEYSSESVIRKYCRIAGQLNDKTARDVALRCRFMTKKESGKTRKNDSNSARRNKNKKEKTTDSSAKTSNQLRARPSGLSDALPLSHIDTDDGISFAIGGVTGELLEQNRQMLKQVSTNFESFKIHDNIDLLSRTRENIHAIMNDFKDTEDVMQLMPPLPVKLNEELANSILPPVKLSEELANSILQRQRQTRQ